MARDLLIHGIHKREFIRQLQSKFHLWSLPEKDLLNFVEKFQDGIRVVDKIALEDYLYNKLQLTVHEQHDQFGIKEIVTYRSRAIGFATAQLVNFYATQTSLESQDGCLTLKKSNIVSLLDFIISVSQALNAKPENTSASLYDFTLEAKKVIQSGLCNEKEFEFYGDELHRFMDWKSSVEQTDYDYYYWEDSF